MTVCGKVRLSVKVVPSASRSRIDGWLGEVLKVRVIAPPERGKANAAVEALLAEVLRIAPGGVRVVLGGNSARKIVEISGLSESVVRQRLEGWILDTVESKSV